MDYDLEKGPVKSGIRRSRRQGGAIRQETGRRIPMPYETVGTEKKGGKMSKRRKRIITLVIAEFFALLFICGYGFFARRWGMIQRMDDWVPEEVENPNFSVDLPQYQKQKGHWGIYIFGVDSRGSNVGKDTNADVNMICDINHDTGEIRLVSVFRDSYLSIDDNGSYNKINRAYFDGGPSNAAKMLNKNLDLNISDFVTFSWKAVADGINLLGGIDMEISRAEFAYINSFITETVEATGVYSQHLTKAGMNHLDGVQAVAYGRLRLMDTDFARTERQRKVIQAAFEKAKQADLATLNQLTLVLFPQVATSVDMQDIISLLGNVGTYYIGETGGFPFARGDANLGRKGACVIPQTLESNVMELHQFLYGEENYIPSETVKKISAKISSDSGMYKQGVSVGHVSTSNGVMPNPSKTARKEEATEKERTEEETKKGTDRTKEEGNGAENKTEDQPESRSREEEVRESRPSSIILPPGEPSGGTKSPLPSEPKSSQGRGETTSAPSEPGRSHETDSRLNPEETLPLETKNPDGPAGQEPLSPAVPGHPQTPGTESPSTPVNPGITATIINPPEAPSKNPEAPSIQSPAAPNSPGEEPIQGEGNITTIPAGPGIS